ncbi:calcium-independent phospholipase A2-gamma [Pungitius pungitius]|uniref:calcium-independent phospholipase A2-gamma n=1 Tax=Pungitius pungitius TaxID=134920 RepID=UPI002E15F8E9
MSRIRSTLDSVTKAVGGTDLIAKFSRLKPGSPAEKSPVKAETPSSGAAASAAETAAREGEKEEGRERTMAEEDPDKRRQRVAGSPSAGAKKSTPGPASAENAAVAKQSGQLFHPAALSNTMDDTYKTLAEHINSYFGTGTQEEEGDNGAPQQRQHTKAGGPISGPARATRGHALVSSPVAGAKGIEAPAASPPPPRSTGELGSPTRTASPDTPAAQPVPAAASKKGFTRYLSYPRPSVQAFVGSYITPLVPKFRGDSRSIAAEGDKPPEEEPAAEKKQKADSDGKKADEVKRQLLIQREKITARVSVDNRTRALVRGLQRVTDVQLLTSRVEELSFHLLEFPETRGVAIKESVLPCLLRLRQARDLPLQAAVREALALVGYAEPVKGRGIRVLAIDGGGTRGLLALQTLHQLQNLTGKRIHQLFDYICGVSTGAILAFMLGIFQIPLEECEEMYRKLGSDVFKQNVIVGTVKMGWSHAFYDSEIWENILKERMGEGRMIESARDPHCPKVSAVSTVVNRGLPLKAYTFRNYRLMPGVRSHYIGDCNHKMWQAIRASSAAPGYFKEFVLGKDLHQDGGLLINNPTALAIHECKCLWPNTPLQCVLSLGTGRYEAADNNGTTYTSLKTKLSHVISSATDTEEVHTMLDALLPPDTYFRFNPYLSEDIPLNESRGERLNFLKGEGERYLQRNDAKLRQAASVLGQEKSAIQRLAEWAKLKANMYEGLPFVSKL